jgi:hypothetical protein
MLPASTRAFMLRTSCVSSGSARRRSIAVSERASTRKLAIGVGSA